MAVYRFRVYIEDDHDVFRDIDVLGKQRFADLHSEVVKSFNFQPSQAVSYYHSDQQWYEGDEVVALDENLEGDHQKIVNHISVPRQRFLCVTSSYKEVGLALELQKILKDEPDVTYPHMAKSSGEPPYFTQPPPEPIVDEPEDSVAAVEGEDMFDGEGPSEEEIERMGKEAEAASKKGAIKAPDFDFSKLKKAAKKKDKPEDGFEQFDMDDLM